MSFAAHAHVPCDQEFNCRRADGIRAPMTIIPKRPAANKSRAGRRIPHAMRADDPPDEFRKYLVTCDFCIRISRIQPCCILKAFE